MSDHIPVRDFAWSESSGSYVSTDPFAVESDPKSHGSEDDEDPFAQHGPIIEADPDEIDMQRGFWSHCAMGFILDYRKFSVPHLQQVIDFAWSIRGSMKVVGRDSSFYFLHFEHMEDLDHMCEEGPWAVDGA